jgi:hypothetical protein
VLKQRRGGTVQRNDLSGIKMTLRRKLAQHGFESNEDFSFALSCVLDAKQKHLRTIELVGTMARRKTAFAQALSAALEFEHSLYADFSDIEPAPKQVVVTDEETGDQREAEPLNRFERTLIEACAYSESGRAVLVLDQLQALPFAEQMRLYHFIQSSEFSAKNAPQSGLRAVQRNLLVVLISTQPLYHSLQKSAFRINTDPSSALFDFRPADFNLPSHASALFDALAALLQQLETQATSSEIAHILSDLEARIRTRDHLRTALFGRIENQSRAQLDDPMLVPLLDAVIDELSKLLGIDEVQLIATPD